MKYAKILFLYLIPFSAVADALQDYTQLNDAVYTVVCAVRKQAPEQKWSARFHDLCQKLSQDVVSCWQMRYLIEECQAALTHQPNRLEDLERALQECSQMLDVVPYEFPDLSEKEQKLYRSCCKHARCMVVDNTVTVGGTFTTNNINVNTGIAQFFGIPTGKILEYAYLYSQNENSRTFPTNSILVFDVGFEKTSHFISSSDFSLSPLNSTIADGIVAPAGVYLFYFRVQAHDDQISSGTPLFVGLSLNGNTALPIAGTQFSSDRNNPATADSPYVIVEGVGTLELPTGGTIGILNKIGQAAYTVPQVDTVQSSLLLVRIRTI